MRNHFLRASGIPTTDTGIVTTNLISHIDVGNSSSYSGSGSSLTDLTGNNNHATIGNTSDVSYSSDDGGHIILDPDGNNKPNVYRDTDNFVNIGTNDFTIEYWFNAYITRNNTWVFRNLSSSSSQLNMGIYIYQEKLRISPFFTGTSTTQPGSWTNLESSAHYTEDDYTGWEHTVFSRIGDGDNNFKIYRNNSLLATVTNKFEYDIAQGGNADRRRTLIGGDNNSGFRGKFAIYRLYDGTGLTSSQVTQNWNAEKARFGH